MAKYVSKILFTKDDIQNMVKRLGKEISNDYQGKELVLIGILKGAFIFLADLAREIETPCNIDFMSISSYGDEMTSSGEVKILKDLDISIEGKHVLVVEDTIDTGYTLAKLLNLLNQRNPASLNLCVAFEKPARKIEVDVKYVGLKTPDEFLVGYGLDYQGVYRNLSQLCVIGDDGEEEN